LYQLARGLLGLIAVLVRPDLSKDAELLVLRHENAVLRRQVARVYSTPVDRVWLAAVSRLLPRRHWAEVFVVTPTTTLAWHRRALRLAQMRLRRTSPTRTFLHRSGDQEAADSHGNRESHLGHRRVQGELVRLGHRIAASTA